MAVPIFHPPPILDEAYLERIVEEVVEDLPSFYDFDEELAFALGESLGSRNNMSRARHWCFTLNNFTPADEERIISLEGTVDYICYGREVGTSGTPHLQGFVTFKNRVRLATAIQKIGQAHFTVARSVDKAIEYCKKDGDFVEVGVPPRGPGARSDLEEFKSSVLAGNLNMKDHRLNFSDVVARYPKFCIDFVMDHMPKKDVPAHALRPWQQVLNHDLNLPPDDRTITFVVDLVGNTGKSWFSHYYCTLHDNAQVLLPGKKVDMAYALDPSIRVLFIDAPRSKQGEYIQYDFLEDVKNGYVFSPKYESRVKQLKSVHVVVMMNELPDMNKLSADRYDVRRI